MELLNIAIPSLLVFLTAYLLLDRMLKNEEKRRIFELKKQNLSVVTPVRLRAYERLTLFVERTMPNSLLVNTVKPGMNSIELHAKLLEAVRLEYSHNISQQIYVSDKVWSGIIAAKENLIQLINTCAASCAAADPADTLAERIIQIYGAGGNAPGETVLALIKEEVGTLF